MASWFKLARTLATSISAPDEPAASSSAGGRVEGLVPVTGEKGGVLGKTSAAISGRSRRPPRMKQRQCLKDCLINASSPFLPLDCRQSAAFQVRNLPPLTHEERSGVDVGGVPIDHSTLTSFDVTMHIITSQ